MQSQGIGLMKRLPPNSINKMLLNEPIYRYLIRKLPEITSSTLYLSVHFLLMSEMGVLLAVACAFNIS
jgi:hypothetical protein